MKNSLFTFSLMPLLAASLIIAAPGVLHSGPQVGERPLPFTSNVLTGTYRGQQHCFICDLKDEPAILVFARHREEPTARLLHHIRDAVRDHKKEKLFSWFVFLGPSGTTDEAALERQTYDFVRANGATSLTVSALENAQGPPGYKLSSQAELTLILFRSGKVLANQAYRAQEWNARAADSALKELDRLLDSPPVPHTEVDRR